jgi:hypothetical protein
MADRALGRPSGLFWSAILAALVVLVGGSVFAYVSYTATSGADGAVQGYFAALARGDAAAALGFGDLPPGRHDLLTSTVLREQRKIARIRHVEVIASQRSGDVATVTVQYRLEFADRTQHVADAVRVVRHKGSWRLARTAAVTRLHLQQAGERATILGAAVPDSDLLIFPGAIPIGFDTPYLRLAPTTSSVAFAARQTTDLTVEVAPMGRAAVYTALAATLRACLSGGVRADPRCPLPTSRAVPGSVRATADPVAVGRAAVIGLEATSAGVMTISGKIKLVARYAALDFQNQPVAKDGVVSLPLTATIPATDPITVDWGGSDG